MEDRRWSSTSLLPASPEGCCCGQAEDTPQAWRHLDALSTEGSQPQWPPGKRRGREGRCPSGTTPAMSSCVGGSCREEGISPFLHSDAKSLTSENSLQETKPPKEGLCLEKWGGSYKPSPALRNDPLSTTCKITATWRLWRETKDTETAGSQAPRRGQMDRGWTDRSWDLGTKFVGVPCMVLSTFPYVQDFL